MRIDRELTQQQVGEGLGVNRNFVYELELNQHKLTIYALNKAYQFLGYLPTVLEIDESTLQGRLFAYRIKNGFTYSYLAEQVGLDKSTLARIERGRSAKPETENMLRTYLSF